MFKFFINFINCILTHFVVLSNKRLGYLCPQRADILAFNKVEQMPKFGLKCFAGSFIFSLAAVVAATRAYSVLSQNNTQPDVKLADIETKNIELFVHNEEADAIYEKFNRLNAQSEPTIQTTETAENTDTLTDTPQVYASIAQKPEPIEPLYTSEEDGIETTAETAEEPSTSENETSVTKITAEAPVTETSDNDDIKIADASEAPEFKIPLIHNKVGKQPSIDVANAAQTNQIALATDDININNLGTDKKAAVTQDDFDDDPWEVAEVANKNITRNKNAEIAEKPQPSGNAVPYKMHDNILLPIPDEIKKEKNLTPQFSSSPENKKLEEELRQRHNQGVLEDETKPIPTPKSLEREAQEQSGTATDDFEEDTPTADLGFEVEDEEEESQSLTDSIAAWFSGSDKKSDAKNKVAPKKKKGNQNAQPQQETSMFRKLLGLGTNTKSGIAPTELRLSFQPNRAEISGQTLDWIKAFSDNVVKYDDVAIEIRIDRSASYELQQKRLKLLYKILANNGVEYQKINIIFTDREPNSFIIRNVRYVTREEKVQAAKMENNPWK